jgi:hypothetical protein
LILRRLCWDRNVVQGKSFCDISLFFSLVFQGYTIRNILIIPFNLETIILQSCFGVSEQCYYKYLHCHALVARMAGSGSQHGCTAEDMFENAFSF